MFCKLCKKKIQFLFSLTFFNWLLCIKKLYSLVINDYCCLFCY
jgi:hypothetical protein